MDKQGNHEQRLWITKGDSLKKEISIVFNGREFEPSFI
jgi:hypothetical protein